MVRAGRAERAAAAFDLAIARCDNEAEREHLSRRRREAIDALTAVSPVATPVVASAH